VILPDVNVLIYAFRSDSTRHADYRAWLQATVDGPAAYGIAPQVLAGVVRITTNPRAYERPSPLAEALDFCEYLCEPANAALIQPGSRHWAIYRDLCLKSRVTGNLTRDAWFAALAIEHGCEWITADEDYRRFPNLRWRRPFD
jgi:toxin-antitoxin system PIN domain toxin